MHQSAVSPARLYTRMRHANHLHNRREANLFYIPALVHPAAGGEQRVLVMRKAMVAMLLLKLIVAAAGNVGNPEGQAKRAVQYIKQHWPFFNRSAGADHFLWVPGDFGACGFNMQVGSKQHGGTSVHCCSLQDP